MHSWCLARVKEYPLTRASGLAQLRGPSLRPEIGSVHSYFLGEPSSGQAHDKANLKLLAQFAANEKFSPGPILAKGFAHGPGPGRPMQRSSHPVILFMK